MKDNRTGYAYYVRGRNEADVDPVPRRGSFPHRDNTFVRLSAVEAYAVDHRRVVRVLGTTIMLSMWPEEGYEAAETMSSLRDGDRVTPSELDAVIPGLPDVQWQFVDDPDAMNYLLVTSADGLQVALSMPRPGVPSRFVAEGTLRGWAARLVTTMTAPP